MPNSDYRIVYQRDIEGYSGGICIVVPTDNEINPETGKTFTVEEIAKKDVPTGKKYKIIPVADVPSDRSFRDSWDVDESDLTDGVGE